MTIRTTLGLSRESSLEEGTPDVVSAAKAAQLRELRIDAARRNRHWTELEESVLVRRGPWLVHADTDELLSRYRGMIFASGSPTITFNEQVEMLWYVDRAGEIQFLERSRAPSTWSEVVARQARRRSGA
jgi:hypothetical protein